MAAPRNTSTTDNAERVLILAELNSRFMTWNTDDPRKRAMEKPPTEDPDTEFKRDFPPDTFGQEAGNTARVWKVYRAHATAHDDALLDGWSGTLDILLIFAGLFSAVATAFIIESYQRLDFDTDGFIVNALYALVTAHNTSGVAFTLPTPPPMAETPSSSTHWINVLWFTSLVLSLAVALLSILVKQWLREYKSRNTASAASPRQWAHRREYLFQALMKYRVADLISVLPLLLHAALFLFLAGSAVFLWDLDRSIAVVVVATASILGVVYAVSIGLPVLRPECPTSTPLVNLIRKAHTSVQIAIIGPEIALRRVIHSFSYLLHEWCRRRRFRSFARLLRRYTPSLRSVNVDTRTRHATDESIIRHYLQSNGDRLDGETLLWMITNVSDSDAVAVALQAIGGLRAMSHAVELLSENTIVRSKLLPPSILTQGELSVVESARVTKAWYLIGYPNSLGRAPSGGGEPFSPEVTSVIHRLRDYAQDSAPYPEFNLLEVASFRDLTSLRSRHNAPATRSATSTIMALLIPLGAQALFLLEYCDLNSPDMNWDLVLGAASSYVPSTTWAGVPDSSAPNIACAARSCTALIALLDAPIDIRRHEEDGYQHPNHPFLPRIILRLMWLASPGYVQVWGWNLELAAIYGSCLPYLLTFLGSEHFPLGDSEQVQRALGLLQSATRLCVDERQTEEARHVVQVALSMLLRATEVSNRVGSADFTEMVQAFIHTLGDFSRGPEFLDLFLLPLSPSSAATIYKELWRHSQREYFLFAVRNLAGGLQKAHQAAHPSARELDHAFFQDMRYDDILVNVANVEHDGNLAHATMLAIAHAHHDRSLGEWAAAVADAAHNAEDHVRALSLRLQETIQMERDRGWLRSND